MCIFSFIDLSQENVLKPLFWRQIAKYFGDTFFTFSHFFHGNFFKTHQYQLEIIAIYGRENEFGDINNLETGQKWAQFELNYFLWVL